MDTPRRRTRQPKHVSGSTSKVGQDHASTGVLLVLGTRDEPPDAASMALVTATAFPSVHCSRRRPDPAVVGPDALLVRWSCQEQQQRGWKSLRTRSRSQRQLGAPSPPETQSFGGSAEPNRARPRPAAAVLARGVGVSCGWGSGGGGRAGARGGRSGGRHGRPRRGEAGRAGELCVRAGGGASGSHRVGGGGEIPL
jgi:hypothetical protein